MNGIFQTPTTENNQGNNYDFIGDTTAGITTITFTGITSTDGTTKVTSESDVNLNQLPRGGMIVSLGSTGGLGVAPLAGAAVTAVKNNAGQITAVGVGTLDRHGSGYRGTVAIGITDIAYEHRFVRSGIGSIKGIINRSSIYSNKCGLYITHRILRHHFTKWSWINTSDTVGIDTGGLVFTCSKDHFVTEHPYPRSCPTPSNSSGGDPIVGIQTAYQISQRKCGNNFCWSRWWRRNRSKYYCYSWCWWYFNLHCCWCWYIIYKSSNYCS